MRIKILSFMLLMLASPVFAASNGKCSAPLRQMVVAGSYYFEHDRYLLATTQLSPFVLDPGCESQADFNAVMTSYVISLYRLGEAGLAYEQLIGTPLPQRSLLFALLWGEKSSLTQDEKVRMDIWEMRNHPENAATKAAEAQLVTPEWSSLAALATDAEDHSVNPQLAAVYSALLPGAGQAYAGAWQAAGLSLVFNGLLLATTVDFSNRGFMFPAILSGTLFSFTYAGGIIGAYQAASTRNRAASGPFQEQLFNDLFPSLPEYRHFRN